MALLASLWMVSCSKEGSPAATAPAAGTPATTTTTKPAPADNGKGTASVPPTGDGVAQATPPSTPVTAPVKPAPRVERTVTTSTPKTTPAPPPDDPAVSAVDAAKSDLLFQLTMLRSQIEQYNAENPRKAYDGRTSLDNFWQPLIKGTYVLRAPFNPLQKSSSVARSPAPGVGWVWATRAGVMSLYAVDENGSWFDESAVMGKGPGSGQKAMIADQKATRESLGAVRSAMLDFYDKQVRETGQGRWPTLSELRGGSVLSKNVPQNPFNHSNKIASATSRQAHSRDVVGNGEGWAYYDGTGGGQATFYANTRFSGQNIW